MIQEKMFRILLVSAFAWLLGNTCISAQVLIDFETGAPGFSVPPATASTGFYVWGDPIGTTYQPEDDRTLTGIRAVFTAQNTGGTGFDDVDNGEVSVQSPIYNVTVASTMSVWYFFGQGFVSNDPNDYNILEYTLNGGTNFTTLASNFDVRILPVWTNATVTIPAGSQFRLRLRSSDGTANGDFIESGIDDFSIISDTNVSVNDIVVNQTDGTATFTLTYNGSNTTGFSVDYNTSDNTATAGDDYTTTTGTVNFNGTSGQTRTVTVNLVDNGIVDPEEYFRLNISNSTNTNVQTGWYGTATIRANDVVTVANAIAAENSGSITFTLTYVGNGIAGGFTIDYTTLPLRARAGADFVTTNGTVTFPPGTVNGDQIQVSIPLVNDAYGEATESFQLVLQNPSSINVRAGNPGEGSITDTDPANVPLTIFEKFNGYYDYASTGGSLRDSSTDLCSITTSSSNTLTSDILPGATIEKAYLIWAHSAPAPDDIVTLDGNTVTASVINNANSNLTGNGLTFFSMLSDVTTIIQNTTDINNHTFTFSDLTIDNDDPYCSGTITLGGWSLIVFYTEPSLTAVRINFYNGFDPQQNGEKDYELSGFYALGTDKAKATILAWEGDDDIRNSEEVTIATSAAGSPFKLVGDGSNNGTTVNNPFNSTIYDNSGATIFQETSTRGIDLDTYDITPYINTAETEATIKVNTGQDLILLNSVLLKIPGNLITGTVFEDINYPGGAGRDLVTSSGIGVDGATVELYREASPGTFVLEDTVLTDSAGVYIFGGMADGTYKVRVVSNTLRSSRNGATCTTCLAVQTFKYDYLSGNLTSNSNQVGGLDPSGSDGGTNDLAGAQTVSDVTIAGEGVANLDFGFNFNTIVNTNRTGQGSIEQFIINSNNLNEIGLDIEPHPNDGTLNPGAGQDVSIFMIPPTGDPLGRTADVLYINPGGYFDINMDNINLTAISAANTSIDGRTQTAYSGNTNTGNIGASGKTVGVGSNILPSFDQPEIQVRKERNSGNLFTIDASDTTIRNIAVYGNNNNHTNILINSGSDTKITENYIGANAIGNVVSNFLNGVLVQGGAADITNNYFVNANKNAIRINNTGGILIRNNHFFENGESTCSNSIGIFDGSAIEIQNNLIERSGRYAINNSGGSQVAISQNTIRETNIKNLCNQTTAAIKSLTSNNQIVGNIINNNAQTGIHLGGGTTFGNLISLNSIYANGTVLDGLGIDHAQDGVTLNDNNDSDFGPNVRFNFPVFEGAAIRGNILKINGWARPGSIIEIFLSDVSQGTALRGSNRLGFSQDYGEGQTFVASVIEGSAADLDTDNSSAYNDIDGNQDTTHKFSFNIPLTFTIPVGSLLTATATLANSTSEFSSSFEVTNSSIITNRRITYRISPTFATTGRPTGRKTTAIFPDNFEDGEDNASFNISMLNSTANTIDRYQVFIENVPYATIPNPNFGNHILETYDNGDGTYNYLFTSTAPLAGNATRQISGGVPVPAGNGISCGCISFYKL